MEFLLSGRPFGFFGSPRLDLSLSIRSYLDQSAGTGNNDTVDPAESRAGPMAAACSGRMLESCRRMGW